MKNSVIKDAISVFEAEIEALKKLKTLIYKNDFEEAIEAIFNNKNRLIVTGMGKSGIIGQKIAASFASTGTNCYFVHPAEAYHGDLGMFKEHDIVIAISYSGETDEVLRILPFLKNNNNKIIALTGNNKSTLATNADYYISTLVEHEACPLNLVPTSSTTATLVVGDAMMVALMNKRHFKKESFAKFHPGGNLGRRLLTKVSSVMRTKNLPIVESETSINNVIYEMSKGRLGCVLVVEDNDLQGIITDGDLRRFIEKYPNILELKAKNIMNKTPKCLNENTSIEELNEFLRENKITTVIISNDGKQILGVAQIYDL